MNTKAIAVTAFCILLIMLCSIGGIKDTIEENKYRKESLEKAYHQLNYDPYSASYMFDELGKKELALYARALYFLGNANISHLELAYEKLSSIPDSYNDRYSEEIKALKNMDNIDRGIRYATKE